VCHRNKFDDVDKNRAELRILSVWIYDISYDRSRNELTITTNQCVARNAKPAHRLTRGLYFDYCYSYCATNEASKGQ
jgi:hypothetical protein